MMKALLGFQGFDDYWSDQPPLLCALHVGLFNLLGPSLSALRILELIFSLVLLVSLLAVLRRSSGLVSGVVALALLSLSAGFFRWSVACLVGLPAYAWVMMGSAWLVCGAGSRSHLWVSFSGLLLGLGAQTKMSALVAAPAILIWLHWKRVGKEGFELPHNVIPRWLAGFAISFIGVRLLTGPSMITIITAHWSSAIREGFAQEPAPAVLITRLLLENWLLTLPAMLGLFIGFVKRRFDTLLPGVWFFTALVVHLWHRPFWHHHFLHFSVPMAWLAGLFIGEMVEQFKAVTWGQLMGRGGRPLIPAFSPGGGEGGDRGSGGDGKPFWRGRRFVQAAAWMWVLLPSLFLSAFLVELPDKWAKETAFLRVDDSGDWECVSVMKQYKAQTRWVFADDALYPFHAGMLTPPEIAVLSTKRLRAGLVTQPELLNLLVHYRAEQVLVRRHVFDEKFMAYVRQHYTAVFEDEPLQLFIRNDLVKKQPEAAKTGQAGASAASPAGGGRNL